MFDLDLQNFIPTSTTQVYYELLTAAQINNGIVASPNNTPAFPAMNVLNSDFQGPLTLTNRTFNNFLPKSILRIKIPKSDFIIRQISEDVCENSKSTFEVLTDDLVSVTSSCTSCVTLLGNNIYEFTAPVFNSSVIQHTITVTVNSVSKNIFFNVQQNPSVVITTTPLSGPYCHTDISQITLSATFTRGTNGFDGQDYNFIWVPDSAIVSGGLNSNSIVVNPERTTSYQVYVSDGLCWSRSDPFIIEVVGTNMMLPDDILTCKDEIDITLIHNPLTSSPIYQWSSGDTDESAEDIPLIMGDNLITVTVTESGCNVMDEIIVYRANCCIETDPGEVSVSPTNPDNVATEAMLLNELYEANTNLPLLNQFSILYDPDANIHIITGQIPSPDIHINGELLIRSFQYNLRFENCNLVFGEKASINVQGKRTIEFDACSLYACDGEMWKGILVDQVANANPAGVVFTNSYLSDAEVGINVRRDSKYIIEGSQFNNNYIDIKLDRFQQAVNFDLSYIANNLFTSANTFLLPPYDSEYKFTAISLDDVEEVIIGKAALNMGNQFQYSEFGIFARNSGMTIYNNIFNYHSNPANISNSNKGSAIYIENDEHLVHRKSQIGQYGSYSKNLFKNSINGIVLNGESEMSIEGNQFGLDNGSSVNDRIYKYCIDVKNANNCVIELSNANTFYDYNYGILVHDINGLTDLEIKENYFYDCVVNTPSKWQGTAIGILGSYYYPGIRNTPNLKIIQNQIGDNSNTYKKNPRIGIMVSSISMPQIVGNQIAFAQSSPPTYISAGIITNLCQAPQINFNEIYNNSYVSGLHANLIGYSSSRSLNPCISNNIISNMGNSMYFHLNHGDARLTTNTFSQYDNAIRLVNADIGMQGDVNRGDDNEWYFSTTGLEPDRVIGSTGSGIAIDWHYDNSNTKYNPDIYGSIVIVDENALSAPDAPFECGDALSPIHRNYAFGRIVADSSRYELEYEDELKYLNQEDLYDVIRKNPELLDLNNSADESFEIAFEALTESNLSKFDSVAMKIENGNYTEANAINTLIDDSLDIETYLKTVYSIYLDKKLSGQEFSHEDSANLETIALLHVMYGGKATIIARNLLLLEIYDEEISSLRKNNAILNTRNDSFLSLFPNPTSNILHLSVIAFDPISINILDITGKRVLSEKYNNRCDISNLRSGLYILEAMDSQGKILRKKFTKL